MDFIKSCCFPVEERAVFVDSNSQLIDQEDPSTWLSNDYKSLVRADTGEVISIVKKSYKVVKNADLIDQLLRQLMNSGYSFKIDHSHSFCTNSELRLQVIFPELLLHDKESEIAFGLYIVNSYDLSKAVSYRFSALRKVCGNGLVLSTVLSSFFGKHTSNFSFEFLDEKIKEAKELFPIIQERINRLENLPVTDVLIEQVSNKISKRLAEKVIEEHEIGKIRQYELLNRLTNYVSHEIEPRLRERYQMSISKVFSL